ncbi:MAG: alpha/beta fold hydrolase [bacterium]|nr:alpha/beta fold hydrolase [bacterium]
MQQRAFIVHGWGGFPGEGWFPWLKRELEHRGFVVQVPAMPAPHTPKLSDWLQTLRETVGRVDEKTIFIGHSLGCYAILKFLENPPSEQVAGGAVLVAGFRALNIPVLNVFYAPPLDWTVIKAHAGKIIAIHSDHDPYVPLAKGEEFRQQLGAQLHVLTGYRHFSGSEGVTELPAALDAVLAISASPPA